MKKIVVFACILFAGAVFAAETPEQETVEIKTKDLEQLRTQVEESTNRLNEVMARLGVIPQGDGRYLLQRKDGSEFIFHLKGKKNGCDVIAIQQVGSNLPPRELYSCNGKISPVLLQ